MDKVAGVIVDRPPDGALTKAWEKLGWQVIIAK
jgi:hypothetical protein